MPPRDDACCGQCERFTLEASPLRAHGYGFCTLDVRPLAGAVMRSTGARCNKNSFAPAADDARAAIAAEVGPVRPFPAPPAPPPAPSPPPPPADGAPAPCAPLITEQRSLL